MKNVYVAMPTYTGRPHVETFHCLLDAVQGIRRQGWGCHLKFTTGNGLIHHARDRFVADFLTTDCTDLVMIDDDLWWEDGAVLRLLSHDCDVVGGVYPKRETPMTFPVKRLPDERIAETGLLKVRMLPGGFMRFTRSCLERMYAHYADLAYEDEAIPGKRNCALFLPALLAKPNGDNELWGEDFMFCRRWTDIGGDVFADTLLAFRHIGRAEYCARYFDYLTGQADGN